MHHALAMTDSSEGLAEDLGRRPTLRSSVAEVVPAGEDRRIGTVLDSRYKLHSCLGQGGMGLVYEAEHVFLKTRVAVKVLHPDMADEEALERLKREAQSASAIGNPHIVDVRDFGTMKDGSTYVVMEMIKGVDLLTEIRWQALPWQRARKIGMQVAEALSAAHEQGIVHRDLKPENVLITAQKGVTDFVKIVDFGIARMQGATKLTAAGRVVGTPEYMAPEQCAGIDVDHRADIYALGILLYEMVTQELPFAHTDLVELLRMQLKQAPVPPREAAPKADIPEGLEAVIMRCMEKRPSRRFQSMSEVHEALETLVAGEAEETGDDDDPARRLQLERGTDGSMGTSPTLLPQTLEAQTLEAQTLEAQTLEAQSLEPAPGKQAGDRVGLIAVAGLVFVGAGAAWFLSAGPSDPAPETSVVEVEVEPVRDIAAGARAEEADVEAADEGTDVRATAEAAEGDVTEAGARQITLSSEPSHARIYLDDAMIGETPMPIRIPPGELNVSLTLRHHGFRDHEITIGHNTAEAINIVLQRRPRTARSQPTGEGEPPAASDGTGGAAPASGTRRRSGFLDPWRE